MLRFTFQRLLTGRVRAPQFSFSSQGKEFYSFDQAMKSKYTEKMKNDKEYSDLDISEIKKKISEDYELKIDQELNDSDSILSSLKSELFSPKSKAREEEDNPAYQKLLQEVKSQIGGNDHEKIKKNSERIIQQLMLNKMPDVSTESLSNPKDYGSYSSIDKNYAYLKDKQLPHQASDDRTWEVGRINQVINSLPSDYSEKLSFESDIRLRQKQNPRMTREEIIDQKLKEVDLQRQYHEQYKVKVDNRDRLTDSTDDPNIYTLSPKAKEDIYRLYLAGWSVRDLSVRYGIIPGRVKAIVWCKTKFYFEILPNVDLGTIKLATDLGQMWGQNNKYIDYGLDMNQLVKENTGMQVPEFEKEKDVDVIRAKKYDKRTQELAEKHRRKALQYNNVLLGYVGKGAKAYKLKEEVVNFGRGTNRLSIMFKKAVIFSDQPHRLPNKVAKNLKQGPRAATVGYNNYGWCK